MKKVSKSSKKSMAVVLSAAMIMSAAAAPVSDAKAKKPSVSPTKINLKVGAKKKIKVKNAKKVTWFVNKAGKKVISLSGKTKKGATVKGLAKGKATITVKMKNSGKPVTKKITVTVAKKSNTSQSKTTQSPVNNATQAPANNATQAPTTAPTPTPTQELTSEPTAEFTSEPTLEPTLEPTPEPSPVNEGYKRVELKLEDAFKQDCGLGENPVFEIDEESGVLRVKDVRTFRFPLPEPVPYGGLVYVEVKGRMGGELGFRSYLVTEQREADKEDQIKDGTLDRYDENIGGEIIEEEEDEGEEEITTGSPALILSYLEENDEEAYEKYTEEGEPVPFEWKFKLRSADSIDPDNPAAATHVQFKASSWNNAIEDIEISSIAVEYKMP